MSFPKKLFKLERTLFFIMVAIALMALLANCKGDANSTITIEMPTANSTLDVTKNRTISQEFKDYWYAGKAEISSYTLEQARYGELRDGTAALIFVTEDFLPEIQVKADRQNESNIPVLKVNATKNFNTGIYPYSVMTSTFYPVFEEKHAIKVSQSMQEWCGHQYAQINNRDQFEVNSHSYFEGEADKNFKLSKDVLENELWAQLRIDPMALPTGNFNAIPDFSFTRMKHVPLKAYKAKGTINATSYTLEYPALNRTLTIQFSEAFPYTIEGWEETFKDGYGAKAKVLTTKATRIKTIKSPYWSKNSNADASLRTELGLE